MDPRRDLRTPIGRKDVTLVGGKLIGLGAVDLEHASVSRMFNYYLGGDKNWAIDRELADRIRLRFPQLSDIVRADRQWRNSVLRYLVGRGVRRYVDIGAGNLSVPSTHQVVDGAMVERGLQASSNVVYVDYEPIAIAHTKIHLRDHGDSGRHDVVNADFRRASKMWKRVLKTNLIDRDSPTAVILTGMLQDLTLDEQGIDVGRQAIARIRDLLPAGSYIAISHITDDGVPIRVRRHLAELKEIFDRRTSSRVWWRPRADVSRMLDGLQLVEPGWTWAPDWKTDGMGPIDRWSKARHSAVWAGVGIKIPEVQHVESGRTATSAAHLE